LVGIGKKKKKGGRFPNRKKKREKKRSIKSALRGTDGMTSVKSKKVNYGKGGGTGGKADGGM